MGGRMGESLNVLILGGGGREHALARRISMCEGLRRLVAMPGNPGMLDLGVILEAGDPLDFPRVAEVVRKHAIDLVLVGPEAPLVAGLRDWLLSQPGMERVRLFGPGAEGAQLEGSKAFAKAFMARHGIPTAGYGIFTQGQEQQAIEYLHHLRPPFVLKADGLAAGKGVLIEPSIASAERAVVQMLQGQFGQASESIVIEEFLEGDELSLFAVLDGTTYTLLPEARDYKRAFTGNKGPNTGGMGTVSPVPYCTDEFRKKVEERVVQPTVAGLREEGIDYRGFLFFGLMRTPEGDPYVIEYNARFGDPEAQVVLPRVEGDFLTLLWKAAGGDMHADDRVLLPAKRSHYVSVSVVSGGYPGDYAKHLPITISPLEGDLLSKDAHIIHAGTGLNAEGELESRGGRVFSCCCGGASLREAIDNAYRVAAHVQFDQQYSREDIGEDLLHFPEA